MTAAIVREVVLNAPIERVWKALTDYREFEAWFQLVLDGPFRVGEVTAGQLTFPGHEGLPFWLRTKAIDAPGHFSFVWPIDETAGPNDSDIKKKVTLVDFMLEPTGHGTRLTLRESGFGNLPEQMRSQKIRDNGGGWDIQLGNIRSHVE